jgi:hypothetical protein
MKGPTCFLCRCKPARVLSAKRGKNFYVHGRDKLAFCSVRCAANWGLLHALEDWHWCLRNDHWVACPEDECEDCQLATEEPAQGGEGEA